MNTANFANCANWLNTRVPVLRATRKEKPGSDGKLSKFCAQCRCHVCIKARPTTVCMACEDKLGNSLYFCDKCSGYKTASKFTSKTFTCRNKIMSFTTFNSFSLHIITSHSITWLTCLF